MQDKTRLPNCQNKTTPDKTYKYEIIKYWQDYGPNKTAALTK